MNQKKEQAASVHFTISIPGSLKVQMGEFPEINWSGVAARAFLQQIQAQTVVRKFAERGISDEEAIERGLRLHKQNSKQLHAEH
jgi:hypothetical protein